MPVDPNIPLSVQVPQPQDPIQTFGRIEALKGALQQQQVQGAQLEGLNQENAMRATQMQNMKTLNGLYMNSIGSDGTIDSGKLSQAMAKNGLGSQIPTVLKGVNDYQQSIQNLAKTKLEVQNLQGDALGSMGQTLKAANGDPQLFLTKLQSAIQQKAVDPQSVAPQIQQVQQSLLQDPTGAAARKLVLGYADQMIGASEKWTALQSQQQTATGAAARGTAALQNASINQQKYLAGERVRILGTATDQASWDAGLQTLKTMGDKLDGVPAQFSPQAAQTFSGKTPHELTTEQQAAANAQNTQSYRTQRLVIAQQNADTNSDRADKPAATNQNFQTKEVDKARQQLDQIHQSRTALGAALQTPNGENYLDPKTGKLSTNEMDDDTRAKLQQQYQNVTNQGQRIIAQYGDDKSGGRIRSNELPPAAGAPAGSSGQSGPQAPQPAASSTPPPQRPAKGNVAPEGTIVQNAQGVRMVKKNGAWQRLP